MQKLSKRQKNNLIIGGLCCILLLMGIGYAAFSTQLKINGTSNISSNWRVLITDITSSDVVGDASNATEPTHTETTATFSTNLVSPGDSITYTITVANQGSIDAVLRSIDVNTGSNDAIKFVTSGIEEGDILLKETTDELKIKVSYDNSVTSQPSTMASTITVTLNYEQATPTDIENAGKPSIGGQKVELVTSGDGLYEDSYEAGRLIYRGTNPNNYVEFNDELWRIVAKEADGTYKIIRNELLPQNEGYTTMAYDASSHRLTENNSYCDNPSWGCGVYASVDGTFQNPSNTKSGTVTENSSIQEYLNGEYYNSLSPSARDNMTSHVYYIGAVDYLDISGGENDSISKNIAGEKMYQWTGNVGLVNVSDVLKASTNPSCKSATDQYDKLNDSGTSTCDSNYLVSFPGQSQIAYWTINAFGSESGLDNGGSSATIAWFAAFSEGASGLGDYIASHVGSGARPVLYLKSDITFVSGNGTEMSPFQIG